MSRRPARYVAEWTEDAAETILTNDEFPRALALGYFVTLFDAGDLAVLREMCAGQRFGWRIEFTAEEARRRWDCSSATAARWLAVFRALGLVQGVF